MILKVTDMFQNLVKSFSKTVSAVTVKEQTNSMLMLMTLEWALMGMVVRCAHTIDHIVYFKILLGCNRFCLLEANQDKG